MARSLEARTPAAAVYRGIDAAVYRESTAAFVLTAIVIALGALAFGLLVDARPFVD